MGYEETKECNGDLHAKIQPCTVELEAGLR